MNDNVAEVKVTANTAEAKAGLDQVTAATQHAMGKMGDSLNGFKSNISGFRTEVKGHLDGFHDDVKGHLNGITGLMTRFSGVIIGIGAVLAGGVWVKGIIDDTIKWNSEAKGLSVSLGITTEEASALNEAIQDLGITTLNSNLSIDTLKRALSMMRRELANNEEAFKNVGVATRSSNGEYKNSLDIFLDAMAYLKSLNGETLQNVEGTKLFKRSWEEVRPLMGLTEEAIAKVSGELREQGRLVTTEGIQKSIEYKQALDQLDDKYHALTITIGNAVTPILTKMGTLLDWVTGIIAYQGKVLDGLIASWNSLGNASGPRGGGGGGGWGDEPGDKPERKSGGMPSAPLGKGRGGGKGGGGGGGEPSIIQEWQNQLDQLKLANKSFQDQTLEMEKAFWAQKLAQGKTATKQEEDQLKAAEKESEKARLQQEQNFWKEKLAECDAGSKEYIAVQHRVLTLEQGINKNRLQGELELIKSKAAANQDSIKDKQAIIDHERALDNIDLAMKKERIAFQERMGHVSKTKELQEYRKLLMDKHALDLKAEQQKAMLDKGDEKKRKEHLNRIALLEKQNGAEIQQLDNQIAIAQANSWEEVFSTISGGFNTLFQGIIAGTQTMASILQGIFTQIVSSISSMLFNMALKAIMNYAAEAFAAGFAWGTAEGGPAVGAAMGSTAFAGTMAATGFLGMMDVGAWNIPSMGLAMLHPGELVMPAVQAEQFRKGGGGDNYHISINAVDAPGVQRLFMKHGRALLKSVNRGLGTHGKAPLASTY